MPKKPKRIEPEVQLAADMLDLMARPTFHRFLFAVMQRSGIAGTSFGTEVATSYHEGRRSLGIDILRLADEALAVRISDGLPFAAMSIAIAEAMRSQPVETSTNATSDDDDDDDGDRAFERR